MKLKEEQDTPAGSFSVLSDEVVEWHISRRLNYRELCRWSSTSSFFYNLLQQRLTQEAKWEIFTQNDSSYFLSKEGIIFLLGRPNPHDITTMTLPNNKPIKNIIPGFDHVFLQDFNGNIYASGPNPYGEHGNGEKNAMDTLDYKLITLPDNKPIKEIVVGSTLSFFKNSTGKWFGSGDNDHGQLAINDADKLNEAHPILLPLPENEGIQAIVTGHKHTFLKTANNWYGCGYGNNGQLALKNSEAKVIKPVVITLPNGKPIRNIIAGLQTSFIFDINGNCYGCGDNDQGRLGVGRKTPWDNKETIQIPEMIKLPDDEQIVDIVANGGGGSTFFKGSNGNWYACGQNNWGQLGIGNQEDQDKPVKVSLPTNEKVIKIVAGKTHTFILDAKGNWYGCGCNARGQLGFSDNKAYILPLLIDFSNYKIPQKVIEEADKKTVTTGI